MRIPTVIPPKTLVQLKRYDDGTPHWKTLIGRKYRVGFYSEKDGLDCLWLVNDAGEYEQTVDRATLLMYFEILKLSGESDLFGKRHGTIGPRRQGRNAVA